MNVTLARRPAKSRDTSPLHQLTREEQFLLNNDTTLMGKSRKTVMKIERDSERQMIAGIVKRVTQKGDCYSRCLPGYWD